MKKTILILFSVLFLNQQVLAVTLFEALTEAYKNNTDLNAERENINISEEDLKISKGNYLPTVTISGSKSQEDTSKLTNTYPKSQIFYSFTKICSKMNHHRTH